MHPQELVHSRFLTRLLATPGGPAFLVAALAGAVDDQRAVLTRLGRLSQEPELQALVRDHQADAARHAQLLAAEHARLGGGAWPGPGVGLVARLDPRRDDVDGLLLLLQVIGERLAAHLQVLAVLAWAGQPRLARLCRGLAHDLGIHVNDYRGRLSRRGDDVALAERRGELREAASQAFAADQCALIGQAISLGLLALDDREQSVWSRTAGDERPWSQGPYWVSTPLPDRRR
jgi:hypothetical protein